MGLKVSTCERSCVQCAMSCAAATGAGNADTLEVEDEAPDPAESYDPAGAVFDETLVGLDDMGKQLIYFSAGTNLPAVRWLFEFGVPRDVRDKNGTTALHCACRSGSLLIVQELHRRGIPPTVIDRHGWTPLHIAIFMNRRDVVLYLLKTSAPIGEQDSRGRTPLDLCTDASTREVIRKFMVGQSNIGGGPGVPPGTSTNIDELDSMEWVFGLEDDRNGGRGLDSLQYEPFFVPRDPLVPDIDHKMELLQLGSTFFNRHPGQGLSFLVASGCARDYPNEMSSFLRRGTLDQAQIGSFLGEPYSISQTLRLELINSQRYTGMTLVDGITRVFELFFIPEDLQKVDRFIHSAARIWWRQHERIYEDQDGLLTDKSAHHRLRKLEPNSGDAGQGDAAAGDDLEMDSLEIRQVLSGAESLYQLMFSVVMLHRSFYENPSGKDHRLSLSKWMELNSGIEEAGSNVPAKVLAAVYRAVDAAFIPQLSFHRTMAHTKQLRLERENTWGESLGEVGGLCSKAAKMEGWVVVAEALKAAGFASAMWYGNVSSIFAESMAGNEIAQRTNSRNAPGVVGPRKLPVTSIPALGHANGQAAKTLGDKGKDHTWLSLVFSVLFLSPSPAAHEVPYAFVHLAQMEVSHDFDLGVVTIRRRIPPALPDNAELAEDQDVKLQKAPRRSRGQKVYEGGRPPVTVVFLLHDGRWQEFNLPRLELRISDEEDCERWAARLLEACKALDDENIGETAEVSHH
mmetsp:Transcript_3660/g.9290  ORF Transcript_3660/g.9290 Transcript_3660/m.9290 type:complete len:741 (-) Transcript_3660:6-2228(-)